MASCGTKPFGHGFFFFEPGDEPSSSNSLASDCQSEDLVSWKPRASGARVSLVLIAFALVVSAPGRSCR